MTQVPLERKVLSENDRIAAQLRGRFRAQGILCLNFISAPGSGKTALLERTLEGIAPGTRVAALAGDIQTDNDARRLARFGFPAQQVTSGGACHLDARMIERALSDWNPGAMDILLIENVGNLVCPTSYDLGEAAKIVLMSVTEGDDKPLKYPAIFFKSSLLIINKTDLLPYVPFDMARARANALQVHPGMEILETSCTTGAGIESWQRWLARRLEQTRASNDLPSQAARAR